MPRANSSVPRHRRHRKIIKQAKGYYGARSRTFKSAKDAVLKAGLYAYRDRRQRKRQFRRLWITRINAACRLNDITYSAFINALNDIYYKSQYSNRFNIKSYIQILKLFVNIFGIITIIALLTGKSPVYFLSGLGALTAVLMLVFKKYTFLKHY